MKRRDFLKGLLIAPVAPAIVKADNLMKLFVPPQAIIGSEEMAISIWPYQAIIGVDPALPGSEETAISIWTYDQEGEYLYSDELSEKIRMLAKMNEIAKE